MVARISTLVGNTLVLVPLAAAFALTNTFPYAVPFLLISVLISITQLVPLDIAWARDNFGRIGWLYVLFTLVSILIYAVIYYKNGLVKNGCLLEATFEQAVYFSATTWTTLGYGDFSPPDNLRLLTSLQALTGLFTSSLFVAFIALWIRESLRINDEYLNKLDQTEVTSVEESEESDQPGT